MMKTIKLIEKQWKRIELYIQNCVHNKIDK